MEEIKEYHTENIGFFIKPQRKIFESQSEYQKIEIFEHEFFGKILRLDGVFQTSEYDDFVYHEPLVHTPLLLHSNPRDVLIIGGGDGGALREILKHRSIEKIVLVELDSMVIDVSKKYLTSINQNSFDDPRVNLIIEDGRSYIKESNETFDVIILDLTDPNKESSDLYTKEFYELLSNSLNKNGILSLHAGSPIFARKDFLRILDNLKFIFSSVIFSSKFIPIYGTELAFVLCSNDPHILDREFRKDPEILKGLKSFNLNKSELIKEW